MGDYEHGVLNYNPKWFWALETANDYKILKFWGSTEPEIRPLRDELMQQIEFNSRPQGNLCWLHVILKRRSLKDFVALNDPAFSSEISASLQQAPGSMLRVRRSIFRRIIYRVLRRTLYHL
jgi:hypothetical protein